MKKRQEGEFERPLTTPEVAEILSVSIEQVKRMFRSGELPGWKPGGTKAGWRMRQVDLTAYMERQVSEEAAKHTKASAA